MNPAWVRNIRDACIAQGVAFHFKQWGGVNKKAQGRTLDGHTWDEMPKRTKGRRHQSQRSGLDAPLFA